ncbi:ABC transporter ATP-binding protein [Paradesulfitobacterium aromaticivorans]
MPNILEAKGLNVQFGGLDAIKNLDFEVPRGEVFGLIGPNGAGKTTILNCISGTCLLSAGEVLFEKIRISGLKPNAIARLGIGRTFQIVKPFSGLTVRENVAIGALFGRKREAQGNLSQALEIADNTLESLGMSSKRYYNVSQLTIADRKRLEVARALAMRPSLLLLDEVMAGLNPKEVELMMDMVREINARGVTVLMIEHVMKAIMGICHRILVLRNGRRIAVGVPAEVVTDEEVIKAYLGERWVANISGKKSASGN